MSLYLKYRPQTFDDVTWQRHIIDILKKQIELWQTMHNYLFFWPRWTWKTTTARILAKAVNCLNPKNWNPCNQCENCVAINKSQTIDFVEIDAASHTQVDNIREEIIDKAPYPPTQLRKKVYIIDEVHMLSKAAFNALLKIMEEPPEYLMFILATTEINKVPDTIVSRCQVFNFRKLTENEIVSRLKYIAEKENIPYTEKALYLIAYVSEWALRDAVKYLEQVSVLWEVNEENVVKFLWIAPEAQIKEFVSLLKKRYQTWNKETLKNVFDFLTKLELWWVDLWVFAKQVLKYIDFNFLEDIQFYSKLSNLFKKIFLNLKSFPNKLLAFKVEIWEFVKNDQNERIESKKEDSLEKENNIEEKKSEKLDEHSQNENKNVEVKSEESDSLEPKEDNINLMNLMSQLIAKCDKISIRAILKKYASIEWYDWKNIEMIIINKVQYKLLTQESNLKYLENLLRDILWKDDISLHIQYMSKEDFLKRKLQENGI